MTPALITVVPFAALGLSVLLAVGVNSWRWSRDRRPELEWARMSTYRWLGLGAGLFAGAPLAAALADRVGGIPQIAAAGGFALTFIACCALGERVVRTPRSPGDTTTLRPRSAWHYATPSQCLALGVWLGCTLPALALVGSHVPAPVLLTALGSVALTAVAAAGHGRWLILEPRGGDALHAESRRAQGVRVTVAAFAVVCVTAVSQVCVETFPHIPRNVPGDVNGILAMFTVVGGILMFWFLAQMISPGRPPRAAAASRSVAHA